MVVGVDGFDGDVDIGQVDLQLLQHTEISGDSLRLPGPTGDDGALGQEGAEVDRQVRRTGRSAFTREPLRFERWRWVAHSAGPYG